MTAVEYLVSCITKLEWDLLEKKIDCEEYGRIYRQNIEQAKEMEIRQIQDACTDVYNKVKETEISDEEIEKCNYTFFKDGVYFIADEISFKEGAIWYREQLKKKQ